MNTMFQRLVTDKIRMLFKKYLSTFLLGSLLIFISCESETVEPVGLRISNAEIFVDCKDSVFTGATSDYEIVYDIDNPFVASVRGDKVIGQHVGSTTIRAVSNGISQEIEVNVLSVNTLFDYPINDYTNGKEFYKDK